MSVVDDDLAGFRRGGTQAETKVQAEKAARAAARSKTEYLTSFLKKDGDSAFIRFIMDEPQWPEFMQHGHVPTCPPPEGIPDEHKANWPAYWFAVCRRSEKADGTTFYPDCYICDHLKKPDGKAISRGLKLWALACIRKEVIGDETMVAEGKIPASMVGRRVSFVDDVVEYPEVKDGKETGVKLRKKRIVVVNFSMKNFFSQFITYANPKIYGTVLDRDYLITRKGESTDVDYIASPMDVIMKPIRNGAGEVTGSEPYDLRDPKFAALYADHGIKLGEVIRRSMSDEYYNRYFNPSVTVKWSNNDDEDTTGGQASASSGSSSNAPAAATAEPTGVSQEKLTAMRDKILANSRNEPAEPSGSAVSEPAGAVAAEPAFSGLVDLS